MKKRSQILVALLSFMLFLMSLPGICAAANEGPPLPKEVNLSSNPHVSITVNTHSDTSIEGISLISEWTCGIADNSDRTVTIMGETTTYEAVEYLDAKVYLQRWNGSGWVDVTSRTYSDRYTFYVRGSSYVSVAGGYYYRTRSVHNANNAGNYDAQSSVSDALWIQ